ncbi:MAG TPA: hypothetical protein VJQ47_09430 [Steroidobacteraceae bacterium]|nr:hypothetical protein [Steroidobacteraceae bacterium]
MTKEKIGTVGSLTGMPAERSHGVAGLPLGSCSAEDELLHPAAPGSHYSTTETSYFGFNIPERQLNGEIYVWFHPVLKVMSASVYIWTGIKSSTLACEYINHHHFLPFPTHGIADYKIEPLGLHIRVIEPLRSVQIDLDDRARGVSFSCRQDAIMPPGVRPGGHHFTQAMKTTGWLSLHGERMEINGYFSRDRSWGKERREDALALPPLTWMVGVFDDEFAFHALAHDDPSLSPEWVQAFPGVKAGEALAWGYLWRDGELTSIARARKLTRRDQNGLAPSCVELTLEDVRGRHLSIRGTVQARMPWQTWQNMNTFFCQTRWECESRIGYGDLQDVQFNDFTRQFAR